MSNIKRIAVLRSRQLRRNSTNAEKIFWNSVRNRKFLGKKFNRQFPIFYDLNGKESFFIADFYCHEEKLIIEIDGKIHEKQIEKDLKRTEILNSLGYKVIRFNNEEIESDVEKVLGKIKIYFDLQ